MLDVSQYKLVRAVRSGTQNVEVLIAQPPQVFRDRLNRNKEHEPRPKQFFVAFGLKDVVWRKARRLSKIWFVTCSVLQVA
jgi:hypothetical protein